MMVILVAVCFMLTGCLDREKHLTLEQMQGIFEKHEIPLSAAKGVHPDNVFIKTLNKVKPEAFMINEDQLVSIYVYNSSNGVKKAIKDFENKTAAADVTAHKKYQVANILMIYDGVDARVDEVVQEMRALVDDTD
ncbi:hypothetical protein [Paenibacillus sp. LHD-38]|uniref:hypothetical protein n=1 Tax=Paenibacillus sp. LHD-38 TaxID=3072143 RepID=UPI00280C9E40|nr:hypothetical protein [Paenibacillus sp. LHD-38]MDQ8734307.1 hypothetical protein [Paenibacillus sp. LHD-38]